MVLNDNHLLVIALLIATDRWKTRQLIIHFLIKNLVVFCCGRYETYRDETTFRILGNCVAAKTLFFICFIHFFSEKARHMTDIRWLTCHTVTDLTNAQSTGAFQSDWAQDSKQQTNYELRQGMETFDGQYWIKSESIIRETRRKKLKR